LPLLHRFVSQKTDTADSTLVKPSNWNDSHIGSADTISLSVYSVTGAYTLAPGVTGNYLVFVTASGQGSGISVNVGSIYLPPVTGALTQNNLPFSNGSSCLYKVFRKDNQQGSVYVFPNAIDTVKTPPVLINGQPSYALVNQYQFAEFMTDGVNWFVTDQN